jgi:hypothetical protein
LAYLLLLAPMLLQVFFHLWALLLLATTPLPLSMRMLAPMLLQVFLPLLASLGRHPTEPDYINFLYPKLKNLG